MNNTGADLPAHRGSLISAFVLTNDIQMPLFQMYTTVQVHIASKCTKLPSYQMRQLVSVVEQAGLNLTLSHPEDGFCRVKAHMI